MGLFGLFGDTAAAETGNEALSNAADLASANPVGFGVRALLRTSSAGEGSDKPLGAVATRYAHPQALEWQRVANELAAKKQYEDSLAATKAWGERARAALGVVQPPKPVGSVGELLGATPQAKAVGDVGAGATSKPVGTTPSQPVPSWEETFRVTDKYR